jgi:hypothetical protein
MWKEAVVNCYDSILLEELGKTTKKPQSGCRSPSRDLNLVPPEYEGVLITRPRRSVSYLRYRNKYIPETQNRLLRLNTAIDTGLFVNIQYRKCKNSHGAFVDSRSQTGDIQRSKTQLAKQKI